MERKLSVLSLDGGGIRGIFSAAVLAAIEEDHKVRVAEKFDLITGTSTGGILALGLGLGLSPKDILDFYFKYSESIFPKWRRCLPMGYLFGSRYGNSGLIGALKAVAPEGVQIHSQERDHSISSKQVKNGLRIWKAV